MNRRTAIRYLAAASAATFLLPACREVPVMEQWSLDKGLQLNGRHQDHLSAILQNVLPLPEEVRAEIEEQEGRTLVAFLQTMLNDLHPAEEVEQYAQGFEAYKNLMTEKELQLSAENGEAAVAIIEETLESEVPETATPEQLEAREALFSFIEKTVGLARAHLAGSGYYLQTYKEYQLIPPPYNGAVEIG